jgi:hypothetical protein
MLADEACNAPPAPQNPSRVLVDGGQEPRQGGTGNPQCGQALNARPCPSKGARVVPRDDLGAGGSRPFATLPDSANCLDGGRPAIGKRSALAFRVIAEENPAYAPEPIVLV